MPTCVGRLPHDTAGTAGGAVRQQGLPVWLMVSSSAEDSRKGGWWERLRLETVAHAAPAVAGAAGAGECGGHRRRRCVADAVRDAGILSLRQVQANNVGRRSVARRSRQVAGRWL